MKLLLLLPSLLPILLLPSPATARPPPSKTAGPPPTTTARDWLNAPTPTTMKDALKQLLHIPTHKRYPTDKNGTSIIMYECMLFPGAEILSLLTYIDPRGKAHIAECDHAVADWASHRYKFLNPKRYECPRCIITEGVPRPIIVYACMGHTMGSCEIKFKLNGRVYTTYKDLEPKCGHQANKGMPHFLYNRALCYVDVEKKNGTAAEEKGQWRTELFPEGDQWTEEGLASWGR